MKNYRKFLEPEYGDVAPEVEIMPPEVMDLEHTKEWRTWSNYESVAAMTAAYKKCNCYPKMMREVATEDIVCSFENREVTLRIYQPENLEKKELPVLIFYHGGAFSMNSIDVYEYVCRYLSCYGKLIVVAPDYHLAPEYKFPIGLNEAYQTLLWAAGHIADYHGDTENISVCGDSSGGNFAAAVSLMARDQKGPKIRRQVLYYPLTTNVEEEMTRSEKCYQTGYFLEYNCMENPMTIYFNHEDEKYSPLASPLLAENLSGLPEACFISAECDPLLDQGLMYAAKLQDAGVEVEYHIIKGMVHGFLNWTYGKTFDALNHAIAFINQSL